jgi:hypothetical protein
MDEIMDQGFKFLDYNPNFAKTTQVNIIEGNINNVRDYKSAELENHKIMINSIHKNLMKKQVV